MEQLKKSNRKPPGYNKRNAEQREYDILFCSNLFLRGYSYREIQKALNEDLAKRETGYTIALSMVYYDLQQALIEWKRERFDNVDDYVTQEIRKLDKMEVEAWNAWEASKTGKARTKSRNSKKPNKVDAEVNDPGYYGYTEEATETSSGNPRFLDLLLNIQQRRAKLLGFDAPIKIDIPGVNRNDGAEKPKYDANAVPDDLLFAVVDKLQQSTFIQEMENKGKPID
ncbi:hypothetical protein [Elizabethkingia phage TCUEAP2]|nr:hypothetical protein [Elizabethkingia phage TCUEAP2]